MLLLLAKSLQPVFEAVHMGDAWLHPWQIPGRQQMKVRVYSFAKLQARSFFQVLFLKRESERNLIFIISNLSLLGCGFRGELGSPIGSLCCHILSSLPIACSHLLQCPSSPADRAGSRLAEPRPRNLSGWMRGRKQSIKSPKTENSCSLLASMQCTTQSTCS